MSISSTRIVERQVGTCRRLGKGIQVHDDQVDRLDAVLPDRRQVLGQVAPRQDAAVHPGMQGLHPAVEHLGKAGHLGDADDGQAGAGQGVGRAAGGHQLQPRAASSWANGTRPVLSETLSSARIRKSVQGRPGPLHLGIWSKLTRACS